MKVQFILSWILRGLGVLAVLVYFFGATQIGEWFPGLIGKSLNPVFYTGIALYVVGAVYYRILFKKERKQQIQEHLEEKAKAALKKNAAPSEDDSNEESV